MILRIAKPLGASKKIEQMTYQEALQEKNKHGETVEFKDIQFKLFVVPLNEHDFSKFTAHFVSNNGDVQDQDSVQFSQNSEFGVAGLTTLKRIEFSSQSQCNESNYDS